MIVDFHTHTFPDKIADKTIAFLAQKGGLPPRRKGTLQSLKESMVRCGIDYSVVLPVATHAKQEKTINELSASINGEEHIFFAGAIHPDCADVEGTLDFIKKCGLFGIKLHPDYQGVHFDDDRYLHIMREAAKRDLMIVTHAGLDVGYRNHVHCTPDMILNALDKLRGIIDNKLVLAHLGGYEMPDEVLEKLVGKPLYMDTAAVLELYPEKCKEIIQAHGADKILFASDSPWADQLEYVNIIKSFHLPKADEENLFYKNAEKILGCELD